MKKRIIMCVLTVCALGAGVIGYRLKAEWQAARAEALRQEVDARFAEILKLQANGQTADAMALLETCLANAKYEAYRSRFFVQKVDLLLAQKDWERTPAALAVCAEQLPDDALLALLRRVFPILQKERQAALLEQTCKDIFLSAAAKKLSAGYAARLWVDLGVAADKRVLPERLVALLDADVQAEQVAQLFERHFYALVDDTAAIQALGVICERIIRTCQTEDVIQSLRVKRLDGAFITGDYDLALEMLEQGIADKPAQWHEMSIPKTKAHRAQAQGKPLEAIAHFRAFMNVLADSDLEEEHDPTTGVAYSREWILGWNAHRISELYATASDPDNAAKAREEAKGLFALALAKAEKDDDTLKALKAELRKIGF